MLGQGCLRAPFQKTIPSPLNLVKDGFLPISWNGSESGLIQRGFRPNVYTLSDRIRDIEKTLTRFGRGCKLFSEKGPAVLTQHNSEFLANLHTLNWPSRGSMKLQNTLRKEFRFYKVCFSYRLHSWELWAWHSRVSSTHALVHLPSCSHAHASLISSSFTFFSARVGPIHMTIVSVAHIHSPQEPSHRSHATSCSDCTWRDALRTCMPQRVTSRPPSRGQATGHDIDQGNWKCVNRNFGLQVWSLWPPPTPENPRC